MTIKPNKPFHPTTIPNKKQATQTNLGLTRVVNEVHYHLNTPEDVIDILEESRVSKRRLVIRYVGDAADADPAIGFVVAHRAAAGALVPMLRGNKRSDHMVLVRDHCIESILSAKGKELMWACEADIDA